MRLSRRIELALIHLNMSFLPQPLARKPIIASTLSDRTMAETWHGLASVVTSECVCRERSLTTVLPSNGRSEKHDGAF